MTCVTAEVNYMIFVKNSQNPENTEIANNVKEIIYIIDLHFTRFYDIIDLIFNI